MIGDRSSGPRDFSDHGSQFTHPPEGCPSSPGPSARQLSLSSTTRAKTGGKGIRTPDFQLAKLALYQLSYAPCELSSLDCGAPIANVRERAFSHALFWSLFLQEQGAYQPAAFAVRKKPKPDVDLCPYCPEAGTAKYAVLAPVTGSIIALPVISPLSFMSLAVSR